MAFPPGAKDRENLSGGSSAEEVYLYDHINLFRD
jgi:hypothetical protein